jgi:hypothetical protein
VKNGTGLEGGGKAGPGLQMRREDRQLKPSEYGDNMKKEEKEEPIRIIGEQSEQTLDYTCVLYECDYRCLDCDYCFFFFRRINHMVLNYLHWSSVYTLSEHHIQQYVQQYPFI